MLIIVFTNNYFTLIFIPSEIRKLVVIVITCSININITITQPITTVDLNVGINGDNNCQIPNKLMNIDDSNS